MGRLQTINEEYALPAVLAKCRQWQTAPQEPSGTLPWAMQVSKESKFEELVNLSRQTRRTLKDVDFECSTPALPGKKRQTLKDIDFECSSSDLVQNDARLQYSRGSIRFRDIVWAICLPANLLHQQC